MFGFILRPMAKKVVVGNIMQATGQTKFQVELMFDAVMHATNIDLSSIDSDVATYWMLSFITVLNHQNGATKEEVFENINVLNKIALHHIQPKQHKIIKWQPNIELFEAARENMRMIFVAYGVES
ncbi:hypothetical protein ABXV18_26940 [Vibrio owensii]|uniref:hypothetical protein n=1 Tax=Vibrio owensii TaxID=696485 RepID=UPI003396C4AB